MLHPCRCQWNENVSDAASQILLKPVCPANHTQKLQPVKELLQKNLVFWKKLMVIKHCDSTYDDIWTKWHSMNAVLQDVSLCSPVEIGKFCQTTWFYIPQDSIFHRNIASHKITSHIQQTQIYKKKENLQLQ